MDWLKKIMDSEETAPQTAAQPATREQREKAFMDDANFADRRLVMADNVYIKFEQDGKVIIQNADTQSAVEFNKEVLLVVYDFFNPEEGNKQVKEFLNNWPAESHDELKKSIALLVGGEILVDEARARELSSIASPLAPSPEKNVHINLINHHYMLKDYVRLAAYRRAIERKVKPDSVAMDLGTGTGILAFFAAKAGARKVYAIERRSDIVEVSKILAEENGIDQKMEYVVGNSTKITTEQIKDKVDVFISEILGSGIFEENVIEFTMDARDRFCNPGASLIPCRLDVYAFGYDAGRQDDIGQEAAEVERMYNLKLSRYKEALVNFVSARYERFNTVHYKIMTEQLLTKSIDFTTVTSSMFRDKLELEVKEDGNLNAFCAYFVAHLDEDTTLTNSPWAPSTHWIQKVFVMPQSLKVQKGQKIPITSVYDGDYRIEFRID